MNNKAISVGLSFVITLTPCLAEVTTDGSVGHALHLPGPNFHIGQDLGSLHGHNLFHSFSHFNLTRSESATFTGDNHIQNVISRVTGGELSNIDGTLKSEIGHAAFYFINPAGIVFGEHAQVDVPGAFYASTAGELRFADGGRFSALHPQGNTLSMAAPAAFGFLGKQTGTIAVNGADLVFKTGATVQLSAAHISMNKAKLTGKGMGLQLASVGSAKQNVAVSVLPDYALQGDLTLKNTELNVSGNGKGWVAVAAGNVNVISSDIYAANTGNLKMSANQGIHMQVGNLTVTHSEISSNAESEGNAGTIKINVDKALKLEKSAHISSSTDAKGTAGTINIKAGAINIISTDSDDDWTSIFSNTQEKSSGAAGKVEIKTDKLTLFGKRAAITADTFGSGNAGTVKVEANTIQIDGNAKPEDNLDGDGAQITASSNDSTGNSGNINVVAQKNITVSNYGSINANTNGSKGKAGTVKVSAQNISLLSHGNINSEAGEGEKGDGKGDGGIVDINVGKALIIRNQAWLGTNTHGKGNAGKVTVNAETIEITGTGSDPTHINSASEDNATGSPGSIEITATKALSINAGNISINSEGHSEQKTNSSHLSVTAPHITLTNGGKINSLSEGNVSASSITINASDWAQLQNSQITTSVDGKQNGNGGNITINSPVVVMDTGFIQANTNAKNASGGSITMNVKQLVASGGNLQIGGKKIPKLTPNSGINVIQAVAPNGVSGNITNNAPQLNIVGALAGITTPQLDLTRVGHDPCSNIARQSTLKNLGKGGVPLFNKGQDGYTIDRLLIKAPDKHTRTTHASDKYAANYDCLPKHNEQHHTLTAKAG